MLQLDDSHRRFLIVFYFHVVNVLIVVIYFCSFVFFFCLFSRLGCGSAYFAIAETVTEGLTPNPLSERRGE